MYDVAIVGAGPAGANLARIIGEKYKVLLIDKRDLDRDNYRLSKCCGGLLAPDSQKMIVRLGLGIPKSILVDPQLFAVRTIDLQTNIERLYQRHYYNMDREKFDRWLVSLIPSQVDKSFNSVFKGFTETQGGYEVKYVCNGKEVSKKTKVLVGADGANSKLRRLIYGNENTPKTYISIQEWFECTTPSSYYTAIFDEQISDFYSWIIPKDNYILLGSALKPKEDAKEKFTLLKEKLTLYGFDFENKVKTEGSFIYRPKRISQLQGGKDNVALIGEAAGAISPSSAEGISYALRTSLYLAECLNEGMEDFLPRYAKRLNKIKQNILIKNAKCPFMFNPTLRHLAMKSGLQSIN